MKKIHLSKNANPALIEYLKNKGWEINIIESYEKITSGISSHPDIYMCKLGVKDEAPVFFGRKERLLGKYPLDVPYNAACTGKYFIHNLKYTDEGLLKAAQDMRLKLVNTRQGYTKCSLALIDENSVITSDEGSAAALNSQGLDVLLISQGHILLKGYEYGFIGGSCGRVGNEVVFNGDLSSHPDYEKIREFILARGLEIKFFKDYPLEDIGSIITEVVSE